jgi:hypothetical protein
MSIGTHTKCVNVCFSYSCCPGMPNFFFVPSRVSSIVWLMMKRFDEKLFIAQASFVSCFFCFFGWSKRRVFLLPCLNLQNNNSCGESKSNVSDEIEYVCTLSL